MQRTRGRRLPSPQVFAPLLYSVSYSRPCKCCMQLKLPPDVCNILPCSANQALLFGELRPPQQSLKCPQARRKGHVLGGGASEAVPFLSYHICCNILDCLMFCNLVFQSNVVVSVISVSLGPPNEELANTIIPAQNEHRSSTGESDVAPAGVFMLLF